MIVGASVPGEQSIVGRIRRRRALEDSEWDEAGYREEETLDGRRWNRKGNRVSAWSSRRGSVKPTSSFCLCCRVHTVRPSRAK